MCKFSPLVLLIGLPKSSNVRATWQHTFKYHRGHSKVCCVVAQTLGVNVIERYPLECIVVISSLPAALRAYGAISWLARYTVSSIWWYWAAERPDNGQCGVGWSFECWELQHIETSWMPLMYIETCEEYQHSKPVKPPCTIYPSQVALGSPVRVRPSICFPYTCTN